jgi:hypothetical protein
MPTPVIVAPLDKTIDNRMVQLRRSTIRDFAQGCQMVCFETKNPDLGKFLEGLGIENVDILYDHWEHFLVIWNNL